jgi:archaellum component FlaC
MRAAIETSNRYEVLSLLQDPIQKPKKPQMVDSSTQTAREISTQTDDALAGIITSVATKTMEQGTQVDAKTIPASARYPLANVDFEVIQVTNENIDDLDNDLPEVQPYFKDAGHDHVENLAFNKGILGKVTGGIANAMKWNAKNVTNWFRTAFYRTENELLRDMCKLDEEIRVSNSWFFSPGKDGREVYYGMNHSSALQTIFINTPKWLWYEGVSSLFTSDRTSTLKLFKVLPHVLQDRIEEVNKAITNNVEKLARVAITVLEDDEYDNTDFLQELEDNLRNELDLHLKSTSEFIIHSMGEVKPGLKKVQQRMNEQLEAHFPEGGNYLDRARYHIDAVKVYSDRFFKIGDQLAQETIKAHQSVIKDSSRFITDSIEDRKGRIHVLVNKLLELRANSQTHFADFQTTVKEFDRAIQS